jgi:hypothetical protein
MLFMIVASTATTITTITAIPAKVDAKYTKQIPEIAVTTDLPSLVWGHWVLCSIDPFARPRLHTQSQPSCSAHDSCLVLCNFELSLKLKHVLDSNHLVGNEADLLVLDVLAQEYSGPLSISANKPRNKEK